MAGTDDCSSDADNGDIRLARRVVHPVAPEVSLSFTFSFTLVGVTTKDSTTAAAGSLVSEDVALSVLVLCAPAEAL